MKQDTQSNGWRGQTGAVLLLAVALAVGTLLRFFRLGARELLSEIDRQQAQSKEVAFRGGATNQ